MTEEEAPIDRSLREAEEKIRKQFFSCIPLFILAILLPVAAWYSFLLPQGESPEDWFQRSGSLTVLFAVWMEYNLMKVNEDVNPSGSVFSQQDELSEKYKGMFKIAQYVVAVLAISGTIIWGYGDFF